MKYRTAPHVAWQQLDDQVILVDLRSGVGMGLNPSATMIWKLLPVSTLSAIAGAVAAEFEIGADEATHDVDGFVAELEQKNLIMRVDE